jgi:hypothetical protein
MLQKATAKLVQAKAVKVVAPKVQKSGTGLVQPKTVKAVAPKVRKAVTEPVQPKAAKSVTLKVQKAVAKLGQLKVAKTLTSKAAPGASKRQQVKVVKVARKSPPKAAQVVAKLAQTNIAQVVATKSLKKAARVVVTQVVKHRQQKAEVAPMVVKPKQLKTAKVATFDAKPAKTPQTALPIAEVQAAVKPVTNSQDEKEKSLELEVAQLKKRLAKASATPVEPVIPAATGTINSHLDGAKTSQPLKAVAALAVDDTFLAARVHDENPAADSSITPGSQPRATPARTWLSPVMQWVSPFFTKIATRVSLAAESTKKKGLTLISTWGQIAQKDLDKQDDVRSEDQSEREHAKTLESAHTGTKDELEGRHGTGAHMSRMPTETSMGRDEQDADAWGALEDQDGDGDFNG